MSETFPERLKEARESNNWTQQEFANRIGCTRATYCNYENGKRHPDDEILRSICGLTGFSADYLLGLSSTKNVSLKRAADITGFSEEVLMYLQKKQANKSNLVNCRGLENKILDYIIRDASFEDVFYSENPNVFALEAEAMLGPTEIPQDQIQTECAEHILDAIKRDWGDEPRTVVDCDDDWRPTEFEGEISLREMQESGLLSMEEEEFLEKQIDFICGECGKTYFLDELAKYLMFDGCKVALCSTIGFQELTEQRDIVIKLGNTSIRFPSEESSQLIETMLLQNVIDSLKKLKKKFQEHEILGNG